MHAYPANLARLVRTQWNQPVEAESMIVLPTYEEADDLPRPRALQEVLSTCYQASLLSDESRPVRFRLILREPERFEAFTGGAGSLHALPFERYLTLAPTQLRRLAPAAPLEQALIGARVSPEGELQIWGLVHSGEHWLQTVEGSRRPLNPLPPSLVVSVAAPGHLAVAKGSLTVVRLLGGRLATPAPGVLEFAEMRPSEGVVDAIVLAFERERQEAGNQWAKINHTVFEQLRRQVALRIVSAMRRLGHGGTMLWLSANLASQPERFAPALNIKYAFRQGESRRRLGRFGLDLFRALARDCGERFGPEHSVTWRDFLASTDPAVIHADEAINELARQIASLSAVDGAVVIAQPMDLLGFGAEISGQLPPVEFVARALDSRFQRTEMESTLNVGTRHRSAYRFCNAFPGASALVVSQDGSVQVVARRGDTVVCSEHLSSGALNV